MKKKFSYFVSAVWCTNSLTARMLQQTQKIIAQHGIEQEH